MDVVQNRRRPGRPRKMKVEIVDEQQQAEEQELPFNYLMKIKSDEDFYVDDGSVAMDEIDHDASDDVSAGDISNDFDALDKKRSTFTDVRRLVKSETIKKRRGRPPLSATNPNKRQQQVKVIKNEHHPQKRRKHSNTTTDDEDYSPSPKFTNKTKRNIKSSAKLTKSTAPLAPPISGMAVTQKRRPGRPRKYPEPQLGQQQRNNDADLMTIGAKRSIRSAGRLLNGPLNTYKSHCTSVVAKKRYRQNDVIRRYDDAMSGDRNWKRNHADGDYEEDEGDDDDDDGEEEDEYDDIDDDEWITTKKRAQLSATKQGHCQRPGRKTRMRKSKRDSLEGNGDEDVAENSDDEISICVPHGFKIIQCLLCGERMPSIHILRQHIQLHAQGEDIDDAVLEAAPIYEHLNPQRRDVDTPVMREFLMKEIRGQRTSELYVILTEAEQELHLSDSETDSATGELDDDDDMDNTGGGVSDCVVFPKKSIPRNVYKCDLCSGDGITFNRRYKANYHQRTAHSGAAEALLPVKCYVCGKGFIGARLLSHHLKTQCERDNKPFPLIQRFWRHLAKANLEQMKNMSQARKSLRPPPPAHVPRDYECDICHLRFVRPEHCIRHKRIHAPDALKFKCPRCPNRFFSRKDNLKLHMQVHLDVTQRTIKEKKILCAECGRSFNRHSNWVIHNRRHHTKEKPYPCKICGKRFVCSTDMKSHEQTHSNVRKHVCNICGKSFGRANLLAKHVSMHNDTSVEVIANDSEQQQDDYHDDEEDEDEGGGGGGDLDDVASISPGSVGNNVQEVELVEEEEVAHMIKNIEIEYVL